MGDVVLQDLKSSSETLDSSFRKATMVQISWSGTGGSVAPKLGMPGILMPFLITPNNSWGGGKVNPSFRVGGGFKPPGESGRFPPGPPRPLIQPRREDSGVPFL